MSHAQKTTLNYRSQLYSILAQFGSKYRDRIHFLVGALFKIAKYMKIKQYKREGEYFSMIFS